MNPLETGPIQSNSASSLMVPLSIGFGAFAVGVVLTYGYVQLNAQQEQLKQMTEMVQKLQQPAVVPAQQVVTRNAPIDLLTVATPAPAPAVTPAPVPEKPAKVIPAAVAAPTPLDTETDTTADSTADKIRALVARSNDPLVSAALAQDAARRETMSVAIHGVSELVDAAKAGKYQLTAIEGGGGVRLSFDGHEEDQAQLEQLLGSAAGAGMIAFNAAVKGSDGSFNGKIILFDLIERALINGSPEERRVGNQIKEEALALLNTSNSALAAAAPANDIGDRIYTVESGDSLAYIALQFYGNTKSYLRIYQANRDKLSSPEKIQIGQKLVIPSA